jgi:two-component system, NarL family, response regulator DesR
VAATPGFESVAEVGSGEEAIEALIELDPDLALVDADMPGLDGYETSRRLRASRPRTVIVLLAPDGADGAPGAASAGAAAVAVKGSLTPRVLQTLWEQHGPA